jgi:hypothetical protein
MELPLIEGTIIRLTVERLPGGGEPKPVWLWWSGTGAEAADRWTWLILAAHPQLRPAHRTNTAHPVTTSDVSWPPARHTNAPPITRRGPSPDVPPDLVMNAGHRHAGRAMGWGKQSFGRAEAVRTPTLLPS